VIADAAALALDDVVFAAAEGAASALDRALARVFQEGEAPVTVIRAVQRHLQRLHLLSARVAAGLSPDEAIRAARPPIFFKQHDSVRRQLRLWREPVLRRHLDLLTQAEARMKATGLPAETICRAALMQLTHLVQ
jgi:DNA polymerase III subunit delta